MKTNLQFLICATLLTAPLHSQTLAWNKNQGQGQKNCFFTTTDVNGNLISAGYIMGTVDMDPGPGTTTLSSLSTSAFVSKIDVNGNLVWAVSLPGDPASYSNCHRALTTDNAGNVYAAGLFKGTVDFDPGAGTQTFTASNYNIFVLKLSPAGQFIWVKAETTPAGISAITTDLNHQLYIAGSFAGQCDMDWGTGVNTFTALGTSDGYVSILDSLGNFVKCFTFGSAGNANNINLIRVSNTNEIYAAGKLTGTVDADPGPGTQNIIGSGNDYFTVKLDQSGIFVFGNRIKLPSSVTITQATNDVYGNIYVAGNFTGSVAFDPSSPGNLVTASPKANFFYKADWSGFFNWVKTIDNPGASYSALYLDGSQRPFLHFTFSGTIDADPGQGSATLSSQFTQDAISLLDANDNFISAIIPAVRGTMCPTAIGDIYVMQSSLNSSSSWAVCRYSSLFTGLTTDKAVKDIAEIFPNPSTGIFSLKISSLNQKILSEIYAVDGRLILSKAYESSGDTIDLSTEPAGIYFVRLKDDDEQIQVKKIIRQ